MHLDAEALVAYCRERLTPYMVPKFIEFVNLLPTSTVGKVLLRELWNWPAALAV